MRTRVDDRLRHELSSCRLLYACEHCAHFDELTETCSQGYPHQEHRRAQLEPGGVVVFCKMFEAS